MNYTSTKIFIVAWVCMFLATFAVSLSSPSIPYFVEELAQVPGDSAKTEELTSINLGILMSLTSVALIIGSFIGGFISDKIGRKNCLILAFTSTIFGFITFIFSQNLPMLFIASFLETLGYYLAGPSFAALIADFSRDSSRGKSFGIYNLSWITAQIPGPVLGGSIAQFFGLKTPFYISFFVAVTTLAFAFLIPKEKQIKETFENDVGSQESEDLSSPRGFRTVLLLFMISSLINGIGNGFINNLFRLYVLFNLEASPAQFGIVSSLGFGLVTAIAQIPGGKLTDEFGRKPLVLLSGLIVPLIPMLAFTSDIWQFILVLGLICFIGNISSPAVSAWLMEHVPSNRRASASGMTRTANGIGMTIGPLLGSYSWSYNPPVVSFTIAAVILGVQLFPYLKVKETKTEKPL